MNRLVEALAEHAHKAWAGWMHYLFRFGTFNDDGSFTISADKTERWIRQKDTSYSDLSEMEKESKRLEAREILQILIAILIGALDGEAK